MLQSQILDLGIISNQTKVQKQKIKKTGRNKKYTSILLNIMGEKWPLWKKMKKISQNWSKNQNFAFSGRYRHKYDFQDAHQRHEVHRGQGGPSPK